MNKPRIQHVVRLVWGLLLLVVLHQVTAVVPLGATSMINDKIAHALIFAVLGLIGYFCWKESVQILWGFIFLAAYGGLIECLQWFVPQRQFSFLDWFADIAGLIIALVVIKLVKRWRAWFLNAEQ